MLTGPSWSQVRTNKQTVNKQQTWILKKCNEHFKWIHINRYFLLEITKNFENLKSSWPQMKMSVMNMDECVCYHTSAYWIQLMKRGNLIIKKSTQSLIYVPFVYYHIHFNLVHYFLVNNKCHYLLWKKLNWQLITRLADTRLGILSW